MKENIKYNSIILGASIFLGLTMLGYLLGKSAIEFKEFERTVYVKGLSERELPADIALWPIQFTRASNSLSDIYSSLESDTDKIIKFLTYNEFDNSEITISAPAIVDKLAQQYGGNSNVGFRYTATQSVTVYSKKVDKVRTTINKLIDLGKKGIVFSGNNYDTRTEFIFTRLNDIKPEMIEEATQKAREVAEKFAKDSNSKLGKIKRASQGQFSIRDRDKNTPHIKKIRVVATVEYYLSD
ncbi:MAG: SIMPL domain-containing protein [Melioribacteraceae bacterium]|nr:SIMPL domain-containing protein [Melioribacteraceae bacterium]